MTKLTKLYNEIVEDKLLNEGKKIKEFIKEIDFAGNKAALEAKIAKCEEAINERKKKIEMSEQLEEMKDMVDTKKVKFLQKEVDELEKSKTKFESILEKMMNKGKSKEDEETLTEDDPNVEMSTSEPEEEDETEGGYGEGALEETHIEGDSGNEICEDEENDLYQESEEIPLNESYKRMQKLAGIITERKTK